MGIRTVGFEKVVRRSTREEKPPSDVTSPLKEETSGKEEKDVSEKKESAGKAATLDEGKDLKPATPTPVAETSGGTGSPSKLRTPGSMARLGGIKAAARKLKKQRKRTRLFARVTATNKILRNSIKTKATMTRRSFRVQETSREKPVTAPSRASTRMCVRRSSREGIIPEAPLRTVELIQRPVELREPATKILFMASLGLYPNAGDSDMTPIIVIKECAGSPGKKNGMRKSLELPLMPIHKRILDGANPEKRNFFENTKSVTKQSKRESQKTSPVPKAERQKSEIKQMSETKRAPEIKQASEIKRTPEIKQTPQIKSESEIKKAPQIKKQVPEIKKAPQVKKQVPEIKKAPETMQSPTFTQSALSSVTDAISFVANNYTKSKANFESLKKSPVNGTAKSMDKSLDLTIATGKRGTVATPIVHDIGKTNSNLKSLLKSNLSPPTMPEKMEEFYPSALDLIQTISAAQNGIGKSSSKPANTFDVTNAMNLIMSSITILPAPVKPPRKRRVYTTHPSLTAKLLEAQMSSTINGVGIPPIRLDDIGNPPRKKQKTIPEMKPSSFLLPVSTVGVGKQSPSRCQNNSFAQPPPMPIQNPEEALNLCVKRSREPPVAVVKSPPKLQNKSSVKSEIKGSINGPKPLNLIIPRPPPLTKAPLDLAKISNPISSQNVQPIQKPKSNSKKPRKPRVNVNNNQHNQSVMQLSLLPQLTSQFAASAESTAHAKSLLKCMNGEENSCAREVGETLDSVKTMLARLQISIGPAVNGVRLITIE